MNLNIGTWNLRGLKDKIKQQELGKECLRYKIDLLAIQETKLKEEDEEDINKDYKLICIPQKKGKHGGLAFLFKRKLESFIGHHEYVSDRVAYLDMKLKKFKENKFCSPK